MKVSGEATLHAPVDKVWAALNDPAVLVRTIPGCERLEATGPDAYAMTVSAGVASIKGTYSGTVALSEQDVPNSFLMTAAGSGGPGTVNTEVRVALAETLDGATRLTYDADAVVGGMVAGVGQRMLVAVAKKTAGEFFKAVDDVLTGRAPAPTDPATAAAEPGVFVAPAAAGAGNDGFVRGLVVGAAIALVGVVGRRPARTAALMRAFIAAAVQVAPPSAPLTADTIADNTARAVHFVRECVAATGAELVVVPESVTTGFTPGVDAERLWDLVSEIPGEVVEPFAKVAAELGVHLVVGSYERGAGRGIVHNAAAVIGASGDVLGVYRKTHPFGGERVDRGGWVTGATTCSSSRPNSAGSA